MISLDIKNILKQRRKELNLTMKQVADACNVSEATVSRWESGDIGDMKRSRISALASILKISPSIIVGYADENDSLGNYDENIDYLSTYYPDLVELYHEIQANDQLVLLFDKAKKLEPKDLAQILKIIDTFNKETK